MRDKLDLAAIRRTATEPGLLGYHLSVLRERDTLTIQQQARDYGLTLSELAYCCFCQAPASESELIELMRYISDKKNFDASKILKALQSLD